MRESGITDAASARRRAAKRLCIHDVHELPELAAIEEELRSQQRLFAGEPHSQRQQRLRQAALAAMTFFRDFDPRVVGAVLDGSAELHTPVCLHLFADPCEAIIHFLHDQAIAPVRKTRRVRLDRERTIQADMLEFTADAVAFEVILLPLHALRQAPLAPGSDAPMARATLAQLRQLIANGDPLTGHR